MRKLSLSFSLALALSAADQKVQLPAPFATPSATNPPKLIPQPEGRKLNAPAGFTVEEYASGFSKPRILLEVAPGTVLVSESTAKGSVIALTNNGKDHKAILTDLDRPFTLAVFKGYLYVSEAESIKRYPFDAKKLSVGPGQEIISLKGYGKGHWTRSIAFDEKANKILVGVGSGSNVDTGDPKDRAAINSYNLDGSGHEIFASGLRNPVSLRKNPVTGKFWVSVQERDGLGDDLVPDFLTEVKPGAFYGWPYAYIGQNEEPRHKGEAPEMVKKSVEPDLVIGAHVSAMDFLFYTGKQFPAKYKNGIFLAERGSGNRATRVGYKIVFFPFQNGKPAGPAEDFVSGWMLDAKEREVWGRPVGLAQLSDGSLLVSEDGNNKIWRIRFGK
ncbi:PQQ-dependent sugar dehydrogenase [Bryobacter aggregatus]|uniref:PQQ-dependent sugar dehydrogenase n=1 Tax=Bryobacter aggregatus TaxID=360054 RepID=UPI0004E182AC|nr:PQQ-dependent sugar dehydrogenase [Bryobacter aggregatus]